MLSEQRVMHMTKMAMIEDKQGRKLGPAIHYRKRDYLSLCTLGGVFLGTLIYAALYDEGVTLLRHLRKDYRELREMYQEEDLSKIPEGWN